MILTGEINPLITELNPICYLLALLGAHHFLHVNRIKVKITVGRPGPVPLCLPQIPRGRLHDPTKSFAVKSQQLTT
jgi:hypothetical protein